MKFSLKSVVFAFFFAACLMMSAGSALAYDAGDMFIRGRLLSVNPNSGSDKIPGTNLEVEVESAIGMEVDFTYMVNPNFGLEVMVGMARHELTIDGNKLGDALVLPPTIIAQYHFLTEGKIKPYAGAGLNYTILYDVKDTNDDEIDLDNSFGLAFQAGADFEINEKLFLNVDLKYISIETKTEDDFNIDINPWILGLGVGMKF